MSDSEDDVPLRVRRTVAVKKEPGSRPSTIDDGDSDSDVPLARRKKTSGATAGKAASDAKNTQNGRGQAGSKAPPKRLSKEVGSDSDSDVPLSKRVKTERPGKKSPAVKQEKTNGKVTPKRKRAAQSADSGAEMDDKKTQKKSRKREASATASPGKKTKEEEEDEEEEYKWWLDQEKDNSIKWTTLDHNGPMFPPPYEPHGVKMKYKGKPIDLEPEAEEVATFFAGVLGTDWGDNPIFQKNFFADFLTILKRQKKASPIKEFSECDFSPIAEHLQQEKEKKKAMSKEEKLKLKEEKAKLDEKYGWAYLDGRKEKVGNYRIEPPGLFRGRGEHPKTGTLKLRVQPEQVTINIGKDAQVPEPPAGHKWADVIHDNTVTWLAMWKENVNESIKYVFLAATSSLKGQSDMKKFEKSRNLKSHIHRIRKDYTAELKDKQMAIRQRATAMYLIDRLALRAGNEKGDDEADTVGCCSLRFEHISLEPPNKVIFDFLGKDSIRYYNEVQVDDQVFKNLKLFKKPPKTDGDQLFDRINTGVLNKHLTTYMAGLTAKVFRTYNASHTFQEELKKTPVDGTVAEKVLAYQRANRQVAILCNHQRAVSKGHHGQIGRIQDKIRAIKYERLLVKREMLDLDPKLKKKRPELAQDESDIDDEFIEKHKVFLEEQEKEKARKKLEKENEKRAEQGKSPLTEAPIPRKSALTMEKLEKKYEQLTDRIKTQKMLLIDKDENKTTALSTSKINYIDPRISAAWCHKYDVPLEKIFNRTLREKFKWALDVDKDWQF
ncbi:DNA topoisomerase 1 [Spizellomyces punctatus DAOM BR117]|uniref:DNA topoisomerase I n=1 Tax=Spizellomyces punctatus (strain DAOM BR117) TaxID=645134 RepID=A0A0L0HDZ5_SPIPD|nr:DNA topoisomerase 1 [Spizellomyces punctatus DAOM BR117]KNC98988.1 hypothetical protein SPPG_05941 [Spizellomyces punctatus DAOM BR117]|eukprot:XP_016607028.1 hypothetical protein SPPG_05941 [Spizellomyces punctatus DAOM BR117]